MHIAIRFSDRLHGVGNVIERHEGVLGRRSVVWLGKLGKAVGPRQVARLTAQVDAGELTHLYLIQRLPNRYEVFCADVVAIAAEHPAHESDTIPDYYDELGLIDQVGTWFKLSAIDHSAELGRLKVLSSGAPLLDTLRRSYAAMFYVGINSSAKI